MNLLLENSCRRFLLGIAGDEDESRAEDAILAGNLDSAEFGILEDGLIDDYVFGDLSPEEALAFTTHFLSSVDRRQKLAFALELVEYAQRQPSTAPEVTGGFPPRHVRRISLPWPGIGVAALAATILLACLAGFQQVLLRRQTQLTRNNQNEIARLQRELATANSRPGLDPLQQPYFVFPRPTRDPLHPPVLLISSHAQLVWISLTLIAPSSGTYTVELYKDHERIWTQPLDAAQADARTIVLPAKLLSSGNYLIQFKYSNSLVQQLFRVERN